MKKWLFKNPHCSNAFFVLYQFKPFKPVVALSLVGNLTRMGLLSLVGQKTVLIIQMVKKHNKNYVVVDEEL